MAVLGGRSLEMEEYRLHWAKYSSTKSYLYINISRLECYEFILGEQGIEEMSRFEVQAEQNSPEQQLQGPLK